ncbi:YwqG family protein [uncultured Cardiobacterium sp.]|uniref:YwqG family protein n=1 Tax=uncultured Cardiobacterium sp. TaxID=417619 RepID=UPI00260BC3B3|nr:YwqG family protein [uncultured Cardiobacterium sp.]
MTTTLEQTLSAHGLHHYWQTVKPLVRNAITFTTHKAEHIPLGASRLGGDPDLPPHIDWPYNGKTPLSFIAQINFADSKPHDHDDRLPASGILYLFYDCEAENWGFDPKDKSGFKVLYYDGDPAALQPRPAPNSDYTFPAASLNFASRTEIPNWSSWLVRDYNWTDEESDAWWEYWETWNEDIRHKLLGHSDNIQGDMELECQLVSHGEYCGDSDAYESERGKALAPGAADWILLLQIDSDEDNCNMMWGDSGRLYLWIRKDDLAARTFDKSWLVLQCY